MSPPFVHPSPVSAEERALRRARLIRFAVIALGVALLIDIAFEIVTVWVPAVQRGEAPIGYDLGIYVNRTRSWLDGEGFYRARQLAGPYVIENGDSLYPPPAILLFLPWALGAPAVLWWLIPFAVVVLSLRKLRPPLWGWVLLVLPVLVYGRTLIAIILGNPSIWGFAAILAGAAYGWPALGALIKPVLAPFALIGAGRRSWWIGLAVVAVVALAFAPMWPDYGRALANAHNDREIWYVVGEIPTAAVLSIVAWALARRVNRGNGPISSALAVPVVAAGKRLRAGFARAHDPVGLAARSIVDD
jgi:hypothetical protein